MKEGLLWGAAGFALGALITYMLTYKPTAPVTTPGPIPSATTVPASTLSLSF